MVVIRREDEGSAAQAIARGVAHTDKAVMGEYVFGGFGVGNRGQVDVAQPLRAKFLQVEARPSPQPLGLLLSYQLGNRMLETIMTRIASERKLLLAPEEQRGCGRFGG